MINTGVESQGLKLVHLSALATNATGKLDVLRHDRDALRVDGAQVSVLEEGDEIRLSGFLEGHDSRALESELQLVLSSSRVVIEAYHVTLKLI